MNDLHRSLLARLRQTNVFDIHSRLGARRQARHLADVLSHEGLAAELARAAGRLLSTRADDDPEAYCLEVLPYLPAIANTATHRAFMAIMRDLYGVEGRTLTRESWRAADEIVRSHAAEPAWAATVLDRARVRRVCVPLGCGAPDGSERWVPYECGEYLYAPGHKRVHDVERRSRPRDAYLFADAEGLPAKAEQLEARIADCIAAAGASGARAIHVRLEAGWRYCTPCVGAVRTALGKQARGDELTPEERMSVRSFAADAVARAAARQDAVIQVACPAAQSSPDAPVPAWEPDFLRGLGEHVAANPDTRFDLLLGPHVPSREAASVARIHPNLMASAAWWPASSALATVASFRERLELLPRTAWCAFYSDAPIVEWVYGVLAVTLDRFSLALAQSIDEDLLDGDDAVDVARAVLHDNARTAYAVRR